MIINSQPPISPALNREPIRSQSSADSSPESTVIQDQKVAPVPDVRVVQQTNEIANSNRLKDPKFDIEQEAKLQPLDTEEKQPAAGQEKVNSQVILTDSEQRQVQQLAERDRDVRAHEQAHLSAAGSRATSGASFTYTDGPDGQRYATGGEVSVDTSPVRGDPEATLRVAEVIQRAALAPAEPSAQDRQVAAAANAMAQVASAELSQQRVEVSQVSASASPESASRPLEGDIEISSETAVEATPAVVSEQSSAAAVERRDHQVQNRQQLLEASFSSVQQGFNGDPRGTNIDSFNQTGNVIQSSGDSAPLSVTVEESRTVVLPGNADEQAAVESDAQVSSVATGVSAASIIKQSVNDDRTPDAVQIDQRDEQVKGRQQQLEGVFNVGEQGLGGEPRGTNLDYFL